MRLNIEQVVLAQKLLRDIQTAVFRELSESRLSSADSRARINAAAAAWREFAAQMDNQLRPTDAVVDDPASQVDRVCFAAMHAAAAADLCRVGYLDLGDIPAGTSRGALWLDARRRYGDEHLGEAPLPTWVVVSDATSSMIESLGLAAAELCGPRSAPPAVVAAAAAPSLHLVSTIDSVVARCAKGVGAGLKAVASLDLVASAVGGAVDWGALEAALRGAGSIQGHVAGLLQEAIRHSQRLLSFVQAIVGIPEWASFSGPGRVLEHLIRRCAGAPDQIAAAHAAVLHAVGRGVTGEAVSRCITGVDDDHARLMHHVPLAVKGIKATLALAVVFPAGAGVPPALGGLLIAWCLGWTADLLDAPHGAVPRLHAGPAARIAAL